MRFTREERNQTVWQRLEAALVDAGADDISNLMRPLFGYVLKERDDARGGIRRRDRRSPGRERRAMSDDLIERLNRAFGSKTGDRPHFTAVAEGDDYLSGRPPTATDRENGSTQ